MNGRTLKDNPKEGILQSGSNSFLLFKYKRIYISDHYPHNFFVIYTRTGHVQILCTSSNGSLNLQCFFLRSKHSTIKGTPGRFFVSAWFFEGNLRHEKCFPHFILFIIDSSLLSLFLRISFAVTARTILSSLLTIYRMTIFDRKKSINIQSSETRTPHRALTFPAIDWWRLRKPVTAVSRKTRLK